MQVQPVTGAITIGFGHEACCKSVFPGHALDNSLEQHGVVRALEVTVSSGRPFSSFGPGVDAYPPSPVTQIGVRLPRDVTACRIEQRVHDMVAAGLVAEVAALHARGLSRTAGQALGYKEIVDHLDGRISEDEAIDMTIARTRQFAVRQERWFRRDPRVRWVDVDGDPVARVAPIVLDALERPPA